MPLNATFTNPRHSDTRALAAWCRCPRSARAVCCSGRTHNVRRADRTARHASGSSDRPFGRIVPDPHFGKCRSIRGPAGDNSLNGMDARLNRSVRADRRFVFSMPEPLRTIAGIGPRECHSNAEGEAARFKRAGRRPGQDRFPADQEDPAWALPTGAERSTTLWIGDPVDAIRLQPDNRPWPFHS